MAKSFKNLLPTLFLCGLLFFILSGVEGSHEHRAWSRLFVFGDSYADTGNIDKALGGAWKVPYGITFPGQPSGRFSDGRLLTDFIANFLSLNTPTPYTTRSLAPMNARYGVNFAFGGTGVFDTTATIKSGLPNMTTQIDLFQQMLSGNDIVQIDANLIDSIAYVSVVGNDYSTFVTNGGSNKELPVFIAKVVNQVALDLQRLLGLGFRKILVTGLQPLGCLPEKTSSSSFQQCDATDNSGVELHNLLLRQAVSILNKHNQIHYKTSEPPVHILDLYNSFFTAFQEKDGYSGGLRFENPLKPCCFGVDANSNCGDVDANGNKLYTLCDDRAAAFFWDTAHPTQAGWEVVYSILKPTLEQAVH